MSNIMAQQSYNTHIENNFNQIIQQNKRMLVTLNQELKEKYGEGKIRKFKFSGFLLKHTMFWALQSIKQSEWRYNNLNCCIQHSKSFFLGEDPLFLCGASDISWNTILSVTYIYVNM